MIDPKIDFKGHSPSNENEELALGHTLKMIHVGANKMVSNATILENYLTSVETQKEQFQYFQPLNMEHPQGYSASSTTHHCSFK